MKGYGNAILSWIIFFAILKLLVMFHTFVCALDDTYIFTVCGPKCHLCFPNSSIYLLYVSKLAIYTCIEQENQIPWCNDHSNASNIVAMEPDYFVLIMGSDNLHTLFI